MPYADRVEPSDHDFVRGPHSDFKAWETTMMVKTLVAGLLAAALACGVSQGALAAPAPSAAPAADGFGVYPPLKGEAYLRYQRQSLYVPVRDGVRLAVDVFRPMTARAVEDKPL